jgi:hypothetical protein
MLKSIYFHDLVIKHGDLRLTIEFVTLLTTGNCNSTANPYKSLKHALSQRLTAFVSRYLVTALNNGGPSVVVLTSLPVGYHS